MPALTDAQWASIQAEYATGATPRALGRAYGVDESTIRQKARKQAWTRDPQAMERIREEADHRTLEAAALLPPSDPATGTRPCGVARGEAEAAMHADLQAVAEDAKAELLARCNLEHLARLGRLKGMFGHYAGLLEAFLVHPGVPEEGKRHSPAEAERLRQAELARALLLNARSDTIASHMQAVVKVAAEIQNQERKALGADDRPKRLELSAPGGGPIETKNTSVLAFADPAKMSTSDLEKIYAAIEVMEGHQERPPIPVPPGDPHAPEPQDDETG